ncbi:MAG TPA: hypothetical protein VF765_29295 [Polyangiaceae bacterium]
MRLSGAVLAGLFFIALVPSCATLVGVEAIPDVDGGSDAALGEDAPGERSLVEQGGEGEAGASCTAPGWGCVPAVPQGWAYELVDQTDTAGCAAGLTTNEVVAAASGSPASCTCTCGVGQEPSCTYGTLTGSIGSMGCGEGTASYDATGKCVTPGGVSPVYLQAAPMTPSGGSCAASVGKSVPLMQETKWRTCGYSGPFDGGCPAGEVCAPVASGLSSCVAVAGNVQCPASYPSSSTVGTGVSDTRSCGVCTCAAPTGVGCSGETLTFYADTGCTSAVETVPIDFSCQQLAGSTYNSYAYAATPGESCGSVAQQPAATGGVSLTGATTLCCAP